MELDGKHIPAFQAGPSEGRKSFFGSFILPGRTVRKTGAMLLALLLAVCLHVPCMAQEQPAEQIPVAPVIIQQTPAVQEPAATQADPVKTRKEQRRERKAERNKAKELPPVTHPDYKVAGGTIHEVTPTVQEDSLKRTVVTAKDLIPPDSVLELLSAREQRRLERALEDSLAGRYSHFFRDTMPISRMCAISLVVPGFGQFHNQQYWKIPIAYASLAGMIWGYATETKAYKPFKERYDYLTSHDGYNRTPELDEIQTQMIRYNTRRQLFMAGIYAAWVYFVCDGAVNYPGKLSSVKKATTLSTILPGAGQIYNRSYWKVPFVLGGFATMAYVIDWNNRGYKRFKTAYQLRTDGDDSTKDEFASYGSVTDQTLLSARNSYRRNRDLCIILTGGLYLLNIIDAHVDAQLKDYDISDDLSMNLTPSLTPFYSQRSSRVDMPGLTFSITF